MNAFIVLDLHELVSTHVRKSFGRHAQAKPQGKNEAHGPDPAPRIGLDPLMLEGVPELEPFGFPDLAWNSHFQGIPVERDPLALVHGFLVDNAVGVGGKTIALFYGDGL